MANQSSKYRQIEDYIKNEIEKNNLKVGDQIMTEEQLCKQFNFSRMTVNKAIGHLVELGYIERIPGKGSFVTAPHLAKSIYTHSSFSEDMRSIGMTPGSKLISYEVIQASKLPDIMEKLHLSENDFIHYFVRLRTGNSIPIAISYTYVSAKIVPAIDISSLDISFYEYLKSIGIKSSSLTWEIKAITPSCQQKELLKIDDVALLKVCHITHCSIENEEIPFEYIETCYNSDLYSYRLQTAR